MITQRFIQGEHEIKIESADSLEDAKQNNFPKGIYTKYYLDGKIIDNYAAMIKFIVDEAKTHNTKLIPTEKDLLKTRRELLQKQNRDIIKNIESLKKQYTDMQVPEYILDNLDGMIDKLSPEGVRVVE